MDLNEIYADVAAFADNEDDVIIEKGVLVFQRNRQTYECALEETASGVEVLFNGSRLPYRKFLAEELGRLTILAEAIRQKRKDVSPYIDTQAQRTDSLDRTSQTESALELLWQECQSRPFGETKLVFLTADAGHGKTALLRRMTQRFAAEYLAHRCDQLLLHIDTQGRSFIRLEEAVAGDLGQLRIGGLFYSGVIRLIRRGLLTIAIDGFDELLAEIGFGEAYSGLGAFLKQLGGSGVVIASARSAYFEMENYAAQTRLLTSLPDTHVTMGLVRLQKWDREQAVKYFENYKSDTGKSVENPESVYDELVIKLGVDHPVLHRPFLVHRLAVLLAESPTGAGALAQELGTSPIQVVPNVINAMLRREVEEKWRDPSGQPYLSLEQHILLLSSIAEEMWNQGKGSLSSEVVQLICETVVEMLNIAPNRRVQIVQRVTAHALLPRNSSAGAELSFDHDEFLNYFLAARLVALLRSLDKFGLQRFCELHPLPFIAAVWAAHIEPWTAKQVKAIIETFDSMTRAEVRSSYLKQNAGLLSSQLANLHGANRDVPFIFESMYFDGEDFHGALLNGATFLRCTFMNIDLSNAKIAGCSFEDCRIDGLTLNSETKLTGTHFDARSSVLGVLRSSSNDGEGMRSYVPDHCQEMLEHAGAVFAIESVATPSKPREIPTEWHHAIESFLRIFSRNSGATESVMKMKLGPRHHIFRTKILPQMLKSGVVRTTEWVGQRDQERYELNFPVDAILKGEDPHSSVPRQVTEFWDQLRENAI